MTLRHRVSTPTWCPEHGRMSGSGLRDMSGMCLKSDLTKSIGKLCDSLIGDKTLPDHESGTRCSVRPVRRAPWWPLADACASARTPWRAP